MFDGPLPREIDPKERLARLRLARSPRIGAVTFHEALGHFGSARAACAELSTISALQAEREQEQLARLSGQFIVWGDAGYPAALAALPDAPPVLAGIGDLGLLARPTLAIVGARDASLAGRRFAAETASALGAAGFVIVSGLARGIDAAAHDIGMDRIEIRRLNMVPPSAMPYRSAMNQMYDSGDFQRVLDAALEKIDWAGFEGRRKAAAARGKLRGIGMGYYLEATGGAPTERAEIKFAEDGFVDVYVGTQSTGQGHETAYVQLTVDQLGIDGEKIRIRQGDTDAIPVGGGTGGARSLYSEGQAILLTSASVIAKGKQAASEALEAAADDIEFSAGRFTVAGTDRGVDILALAAQQRGRPGATQLDAAEIAKIETHTFPNGCHMAEVEVDPDTGTIAVVRYIVCDDVGRAVNPMIVKGQVHGGVAQGVGQALMERTSYDAESGQLLSGSFMDYALPRASDLPDVEVDLIEVPCTSNPLGVKGAGEAGAVGSPPAVMNALVDALRTRGVDSIDMPATPEKVWRAIHLAA